MRDGNRLFIVRQLRIWVKRVEQKLAQ